MYTSDEFSGSANLFVQARTTVCMETSRKQTCVCSKKCLFVEDVFCEAFWYLWGCKKGVWDCIDANVQNVLKLTVFERFCLDVSEMHS